MEKVIELSIQLNEMIKQSSDYQRYIDAKNKLYQNDELKNRLLEYKRRNFELQNLQGVNPFDDMNNLAREFDDVIHNSIVSEFLAAERHICILMQKVFDSITNGLEFEI